MRIISLLTAISCRYGNGAVTRLGKYSAIEYRSAVVSHDQRLRSNIRSASLLDDAALLHLLPWDGIIANLVQEWIARWISGSVSCRRHIFVFFDKQRVSIAASDSHRVGGRGREAVRGEG